MSAVITLSKALSMSSAAATKALETFVPTWKDALAAGLPKAALFQVEAVLKGKAHGWTVSKAPEGHALTFSKGERSFTARYSSSCFVQTVTGDGLAILAGHKGKHVDMVKHLVTT